MTFWRPWLAHWFSLRPTDVGDLTPGDLTDCLAFMEAQRG